MESCNYNPKDCYSNSLGLHKEADAQNSGHPIKSTETNCNFLPASKPVIEGSTLCSRCVSKLPIEATKAAIKNESVPFVQLEAWKKSRRNSPVFPISFLGKDFLKVDPKTGLGSIIPKDVKAIWICEPVDNPSVYRQNGELRLSNILTKGFDNVCKVVWMSPEGKAIPYSAKCNQFVNYLSFGMTYQEADTPESWYESLPFIETLPFSEADLKWGDIVELSQDKTFVHFLFYIGNGKYISKHGGLDIYIQDLDSSKINYPCNSLRILRLLPDFYNKKIDWQKSY